MKKRALCFLSLFLAFAFLCSPSIVKAAPVAMPSHVAAPSSLLPVAAEIGQQIQALVTGEEGGEIEPQETFGTRALGLLLTSFEVLRQESVGFVTNFAALPQVASWFNQQINDPTLSARWGLIGGRLVLVVGGAFVAGWIASLILLPLRRRVKRHRTDALAGRFGALVLWFFLSLLPVVVFLAAAIALMDPSEPMKLVRYVVMTVVYAAALFQILRLMSRFLLAPKAPSLRFVPLSTSQSAYAHRWISLFAAVMIAGYFGADIARVVRVPAGAISAFNNLIGFVIVAMAVTVIVQKRSFVSSFLRGDLSAARHGLSLWQSLRLWLARVWHILAISYIVIGYIVTSLSAGGGFELMQRGTVLTLLVLLCMRLAFYLTAKIGYARPAKASGGEVSSGIYKPVLQVLLRIATWALGIAAILASWGMDVGALLASAWGQRILGSAFSITSTLVLVVFIYEAIHAVIERHLHHRDAEGHIIDVNPRAQTLLPMLRNAAILVLTVIVGLVTLSELGINIGPLLAGAGVLGVAIGFGSQTLVKDFLTGLFIILEDTISVGDVVSIGDNAGVVESITIRTVRLRDLQGNLHILPFSEITKIVNQTKGFSYALIDLNVAYESDLEHVMEVMKKLGEDLRADPAFQNLIIAPLEMFGVETLGDSSVTVRCRLKTKPGQQWLVKRAYLLRIKKRFEAENIEIPYPTITHIQRRQEPVTDPVAASPLAPKKP
jgi:small conductance mechanosensitive channel